MRIRIRLKGMADADLIALRLNPSFHFERAVIMAVRAYVRGESLTIPSPLPFPCEIDLKKEHIISISFNDSTEADLIDWYESFPEGFRTLAIKAILRCALSAPYISAFAGASAPAPAAKPALAKQEKPAAAKKTAPKQAPVDSEPEPLETPSGEDDIFGDDSFIENF